MVEQDDGMPHDANGDSADGDKAVAASWWAEVTDCADAKDFASAR